MRLCYTYEDTRNSRVESLARALASQARGRENELLAAVFRYELCQRNL